MPSKIEWCDGTKNPVKVKGPDGKPHGHHCTKISEGCAHCYGEPINNRFGNKIPYDDREVEYVLDRKVFEQIGTWRKPRRCFTQSMSDLFHERIPDDLVGEVLWTLNIFKRHKYIFLTKRPERMKDIFAAEFPAGAPKHFWLGVTVENQARADERIPVLLSIPAAVHFVSVEPCLGAVDLSRYLLPYYYGGDKKVAKAIPRDIEYKPLRIRQSLDWVILGGESGPGARPMHPDWARGVRDQCNAAGVAFLFKQWGA
jgi:protein gp37